MKNSNLWNFACRSLPILGIALLSACASSPKVGPRSAAATEIAVNVKSARASYEAGNFSRAAKFYELALARARSLDDSAEIGRNAYNAAACLLRAGDAKTAAALLVEADREFVRSKLNRIPVLILQSRAALSLNQIDAAAAFALEGVRFAKTGDERVGTALALADVRLRQGDTENAGKLLVSARTDSQRSATTEPDLVSAEARLLAARSEHARAATTFIAASELWRRAGNAGELAAALQAAGNELAKCGEAEQSALLFYRAARSYFGQHDNLAAMVCVQVAMKSAESAKNENLATQIAALFDEIKKSVEPVAESP